MGPMAKFELSDAVTLFTDEASAINHVWTIYGLIAAAAAGYGISGAPLRPAAAIAVTLAFSAFAFGNWQLLKQALRIHNVLHDDIIAAISAEGDDNPFKSSIKCLVATANPPWISLVIHLTSDVCVVVAIWIRVPEALALIGKLI
jgi:hypothetical protein